MDNFLAVAEIYGTNQLGEYPSCLFFRQSFFLAYVLKQLSSLKVLHDKICPQGFLIQESIIHRHDVWVLETLQSFSLPEHHVDVTGRVDGFWLGDFYRDFYPGLLVLRKTHGTKASVSKRLQNLVLVVVGHNIKIVALGNV